MGLSEKPMPALDSIADDAVVLREATRVLLQILREPNTYEPVYARLVFDVWKTGMENREE